ncbi:MAG: DUF58 domain-containing protein [Armatimonadetes bacterium]|nr:DUF58 domain-containing protein [Armatimonadota bacterium]
MLGMIFTVRFVIILTAGGVLIGVSGWSRHLMTAGVAVISLAVVMALAEWIGLSRQRLEVARVCDDKLSLGAENPVGIRLRNPAYTRVRATLRDEYPEGFEADGNVMPVDMGPRSECDLVYHVTPLNRGDYQFADIYVRFHGRLGLVVRQVKYPARRGVKVYPNLLDMKRYDIGLRREHIAQPGQRVVRYRGRGTDFESLRDYVPDDEFRAVDWKASARRGKLVTRQYQEEKSQNVLLVLDCGRVMGPVIAGLTRLDHGINAAMMLAHVAAQRGDKVGMMAFGEDIISYSPPKAGKSQSIKLLRLAYNLEEAAGDSNYYRAIPYLSRKWTRRSLVVFFIDLVDPESSKPLISQINSLTRKHLCMCVAMSDPAVIEAARSRPENAEDVFRGAAAKQVVQARKRAAAQLARAGAIVLDVLPDKFTPAVVNEYLRVKSAARL